MKCPSQVWLACVQRTRRHNMRAKFPTCIMLVRYSGTGMTFNLCWQSSFDTNWDFWFPTPGNFSCVTHAKVNFVLNILKITPSLDHILNLYFSPSNTLTTWPDLQSAIKPWFRLKSSGGSCLKLRFLRFFKVCVSWSWAKSSHEMTLESWSPAAGQRRTWFTKSWPMLKT